MRPSRSRCRGGRISWKWAASRSRARATSSCGTRAYAPRTSATDAAARATAGGGPRDGSDLREPRARARPDLYDDRDRQLRAGRDGDVRDLRGLVADHEPRLLLLDGVRPDARARLLGRRGGAAGPHPAPP